jgi:4-amino-4-deoxy-L-arabinose transferase-like glycosyltransferase
MTRSTRSIDRWRVAGPAIVVGIVLAVLFGLAISRPESSLVSTNTRVSASGVVITIEPGETRCQDEEYVPSTVTRVRMFAGFPSSTTGPGLHLAVRRDGQVVGTGDVAAGYEAGPLDIPLHVDGTTDPGDICITNAGDVPVVFGGNLTQLGSADLAYRVDSSGQLVGDDVRVDYFRDRQPALVDELGEVARRFALFKPQWFGSGLLAVVAGLTALFVVAALAVAVVGSRGDRIDGRRARWLLVLCGTVGMLNSWAWALTTPPLQVPDEIPHVGYATYLGETGRVPQPQDLELGAYRTFSPEWNDVQWAVPFTLESPPSWSRWHDDYLRAELDRHRGGALESGAASAASYPPLYYAWEAIPAATGQGLDAITRLSLMRLWSAVLAGVTVAGTFLFVRELLPSSPAAAIAGALAVACHPLVAFISGGVNNDGMLWAVCALLLAVVARSLRRGLTARRAVAIGALLGAGILTKALAIALIPGVALAIVVAGLRARTEETDRWRPVLRGIAWSAGTTVAVVGAWIVAGVTAYHRTVSEALGGSGDFQGGEAAPTAAGQVLYFWKYYLPRLPGMDATITVMWYPVWQTLIQGFVGRFGWFQFGFTAATNVAGLIVLLVMLGLTIVTLVRRHEALRARLAELAVYGTMLLGAVVFLGVIGYRYVLANGIPFEQTRYLFTVLPLYAAIVGLATMAFGRRWERGIAIALVALAAGHSVFSLLLAVQRYYV